MAFPAKHGHPISAHDKAVLSQIFNPGFPAGDNEETTDPDQNDGVNLLVNLTTDQDFVYLGLDFEN